MLDFLMISTRSGKRGIIEIYPKFIIKKSNDLMIRGGDFYAIWIDERGIWSTDEQDAVDLIDRELDQYAEENRKRFDGNIRVLHMWDAETGMIDTWHKYCQKQMKDQFHMLDEKLIFSNTKSGKRDFASKALPYPLEPGDTPAWDKLISTLYSPEERHKIEWSIGAIVSGESKRIQKFLVFYGAVGTGKSTIINVIQQLFEGYYTSFNAKDLGSSSNAFALEAFRSNPLVAIQHDGDLSRIEDNTRINSLVSHEMMTVNEKFRSAYSNRFKAFLIMGTNKPVKITDAKSGIIRRLIDVTPTGDKVPPAEYRTLTKQIPFELGGIAYHCQEVYLEDPDYYDDYIPISMMGASNDFYNFVVDSYHVFKQVQELAQKIMPLLSEHSNNITLNEKLFARVKEVYDQKETLQLTQEQSQLLENAYNSFVRHGANLEGEAREEYRKLTTELSKLTLDFSENNLKETNSYQMLLTKKESLAGLPEIIVEAAAETAKSEGKEGWAFTLHAPSYVPFMTYADNRDLRHRLYMAYNTKCTHDNEFNNIDIVKKIANTRMKIAQLLGYKDYAEYTLKRRMAENSRAVYKLLNQLLEAYTPTAEAEYKDVQELARLEQGNDFILMPWDWSYYSNKLKDKKFNINEEMLRPYFELEQVKKGVFGLAEKLYGITFQKNTEIPVYHKEVEAYEVFDKDGQFLAILYTDFHPRLGKRAGAWMTSYKEQWIDKKTGENSRPHISVVMNFTKPTENKPALLTFNEVETFLHEFGHSLHGMFANSTYKSLSGTNVYWDFVELPSQIMENFAIEKDFLNTFARHYQTGEVLPDELIQRLVDASNFNVAYACLRQISFGLLDMAWYTRNVPFEGDVKVYEQEAWKKAQILPVVKETCMSTQFSHIFAGGYSAGYYSYKWAEVLDADAFSLFKQKGIFNQDVAESFRNNILSKGGTEHPMVLYKRFRGQEPTIDALLIRNGIKN